MYICIYITHTWNMEAKILTKFRSQIDLWLTHTHWFGLTCSLFPPHRDADTQSCTPQPWCQGHLRRVWINTWSPTMGKPSLASLLPSPQQPWPGDFRDSGRLTMGEHPWGRGGWKRPRPWTEVAGDDSVGKQHFLKNFHVGLQLMR